MTTTVPASCCVVGGGPAGMMLGYLLARAGIEVTVVEKHGDFLRDFRGDTIHPSTLQLMQQLGILHQFLQRPHDKIEQAIVQFGDRALVVADFSTLDVCCPYIAIMPQWDFLDFLAQEAARLPTFRLLMNTEATDLLNEGDRITGIKTQGSGGTREILASLVVGADGRSSILRAAAELAVEDIGAPMDVLWMRLEKSAQVTENVFARMAAGRILITINRGDYWQCAYVFAKDTYQELKQKGLSSLRESIAATAPELSNQLHTLRNWEDLSLLTVKVDRLQQWWRPGLLFIGDAAHAMSPVGGVGINLAIQDAVAAANALTAPMLGGLTLERALQQVQQRREPPTRTTQRIQVFVQNQVLGKVLAGATSPPLPLRVLNAIPFLRRFPARAIGLGTRPESVETSHYFVDSQVSAGAS